MNASEDSGNSTTRLPTTDKTQPTLAPVSRLQPVLFLPTKHNRLGQGGLRYRSVFKKSSSETPLVTVITVVFNDVKHIENTILSVISQSYVNIEYIIIDGGSTDGTLEIIGHYDGKIDYWISEGDECLYEAMNKAVESSTGTWLNFMNSGDVFTDNESISQAMDFSTSGADVIYSDHYRYNEARGSLERVTCDIHCLRILHQSMVYRRYLHEKHGMYLASKGLTIADYIFFNLLDKNSFIKSPYPISKNLEGGISSGSNHIRERFAVDYLFNNMSLLEIVVSIAAAHLKRLVNRFTQ